VIAHHREIGPEQIGSRRHEYPFQSSRVRTAPPCLVALHAPGVQRGDEHVSGGTWMAAGTCTGAASRAPSVVAPDPVPAEVRGSSASRWQAAASRTNASTPTAVKPMCCTC
jgi:hypothetical protein